jgi:hypothetical protein
MAGAPPPAAPGPNAAVAQQLWDYMLRQQDFSVGQFTTGLIGLGALLFAYGSVPKDDDYVRIGIAITGFGAAFILWMHTFGARMDAHKALEQLQTAGPDLWAAYGLIMAWRNQHGWGNVYASVTRLAIYFNGLLMVAWGTIFLYTLTTRPVRYLPASVTIWDLVAVDVVALVVAGFLWVALRD